MVKQKVEGAYESILQTAGDQVFRNIELKTIWTLIETTIVMIATDTSEVWNPNEEENNEHNKILENIIRKVLELPESTPRE